MELNLCMGCMREKEEQVPCPHCGFDDRTYEILPHHLPPGTILNGKYMLGKVLGEGGFGITYLGWDINLQLKVAIKEYYPNGLVTRGTTSDCKVTILTGKRSEIFQKGLNKFVDEARRLAKFWGLPGIVAVKDYFEANRTAYIVMEFAEGRTLKQLLASNEGLMDVDTVLTMMRPVMDALEMVHQSGMIHRDISPDNLMVDRKGKVKLLDFGAARSFMENDGKSLSVMLKPGYAPLEQYSSNGEQGPWTDVYGLCATIYRAITGFVPLEVMERMVKDELKKPSDYGVRIHPAQEAAIMKGLTILKKDRIQSVSELRILLYQDMTDGEDAQRRSKETYQNQSEEHQRQEEERQKQEAENRRREEERQRQEAENRRREEERQKQEAEHQRQEEERQRQEAENRRREEERQRQEAERQRWEAERQKKETEKKGTDSKKLLSYMTIACGILAVIAIALIGFFVLSGRQDSSTQTTGRTANLPVESSNVIDWNDSCMERMVRKALDRPEGDIYESDLEAITVLRMMSNEISMLEDTQGDEKLTGSYMEVVLLSLEDLQYFPNLKVLQISNHHELADESILCGEGFRSALEGLEELTLSDDGISDLSFLEGLENLTSLDISGNMIQDIEILSEFTALEQLNIAANEKLNTISPIKDLESLRELKLYGLTEVSPYELCSMTGLTSLDMSGMDLQDLDFLSGLTQLKELDLGYNDFNNIDDLKTLTSLETLYLTHGDMTDIEVLENLDNLQILDIGSAQDVESLAPLQNLTNLKELHVDFVDAAETWEGREVIQYLCSNGQLENLDMAGVDVTNLDFLKGASDLRVLDVSYSTLEDIGGIENLTKLEELDLSSNEGTFSLEALLWLANLKTLDLNKSDVEDISMLSFVTSLETLDLSYNSLQDGDLEDLMPWLTNLKDLDLSHNELQDISFLQELEGLETLSLRYNEISDLSPLQNLCNLQECDLEENPVRGIEPLGGLTNLRKLYLSGDGICELEPLGNLTRLERLDISNAAVEDYTSLAGLTSLERLEITNNAVPVSCKELGELQQLIYLDLSGNNLDDIEGLNALEYLSTLYLSNNQIRDISVLNGLERLETLHLSKNPLQDISVLEDFTYLRSLYMDDCGINDVSSLQGLIHMEYLYLSDNNITDPSPLASLINLRRLDLSDNQGIDVSSLEAVPEVAAALET